MLRASIFDVTDGPKLVLIWSRLRKLAPQKVRSAPQAATTVLFIPDDWRDGCQKHAE